MTIKQLDNMTIDRETVYYSAHIFPERGYAKQLETAYKTAQNAIKAAALYLYNHGGKEAVIRENVVYKRIPGRLELSTSGKIKTVSLEYISDSKANVIVA